jgi:hypothetical protein
MNKTPIFSAGFNVDSQHQNSYKFNRLYKAGYEPSATPFTQIQSNLEGLM